MDANTRRARLSIGDVGITLTSVSGGPRLELPEAIRPFGDADAASDVTLEVEYGSPSVEVGTPLFDSGATWRVSTTTAGLVYSVTSPLMGAEPYAAVAVDRGLTRGRVVLRQHTENRRSEYPLECPLDELLVTALLAKGRGVELHACGVVTEDGRGLLFAGHSGDGKSTLARLWHEGGVKVLGDDRIIVRMDAEGAWMYGTPWHRTDGFGEPLRAPLSAILILEHGPQNRVLSLSPASVVAELLARSFPPLYSDDGMAFTVGFLHRLTHAVLSQRFEFVPDHSALDFVLSALRNEKLER